MNGTLSVKIEVRRAAGMLAPAPSVVIEVVAPEGRPSTTEALTRLANECAKELVEAMTPPRMEVRPK